MSAIGLNTQIGRYSRCLVNAAMARGNAPSTLRSSVRHVATTAKPRATKKVVTSSEETAAVTKKALSTKSPATASTKTPRKKKVDAVVSEMSASEEVVAAPKKSTRAASTKSSAATPKKKTDVKILPWSKTAGTASVASRPIPVSLASARLAASAAPKPPKPVDIKSPEYKSAARKWTSLMVALPILAVSSYYLYDRLVLGNEPKGLEALRKATKEASEASLPDPGPKASDP